MITIPELAAEALGLTLPITCPVGSVQRIRLR